MPSSIIHGRVFEVLKIVFRLMRLGVVVVGTVVLSVVALALVGGVVYV